VSKGLHATVRDLGRRKARRRRNLTLAEGTRLVDELLRAKASIRGVVTAPMLQATDRGASLKSAMARMDVPMLEVSDVELIELADTEHPQGVIAVVEPPEGRLEDIEVAPGRPALVLDGVQDPGNVGALCRTALGLGAGGVIALPGTAELFGPKALRGSMGALFHLPAVRSEDDVVLSWMKGQHIELWLATAGGTPVGQIDTRERRIALAVGNEGAGARASLSEHAVHRISVPLDSSAESLNVAVAAGILLYEVVHAR